MMSSVGWLASAAEVDITPPVGVRLEGYDERVAPSTHILDPLRAGCLVLQAGEERCALVTVDLIGIPADVVAECRRMASEVTGIAPASILVAASHTHGAPGRRLGNVHMEAYLASLPHTLAGLIVAASQEPRPARLAVGRGSCDTVQLNRRNSDGPIDPDVRVLRVEDQATGALLAALVNVVCHPTILSPSQLGISADYFGAVRRTVRRIEGAHAVVLVTNGACGDINPTKWRENRTEVDRVGAIFGLEAARVLEELRTSHDALLVSTPEGATVESPDGWGVVTKLPPADAAPLDVASIRTQCRMVTLPTRAIEPPERLRAQRAEVGAALAAMSPGTPTWHRQKFLLMRLGHEIDRGETPAGEKTVEIQALRLGGRFVLATIPGELFVEIGERIKARIAAAGDWPMVVGYANDYVGYIPTDAAFDWHGYEVGISLFDRGTEARLLAAVDESVEATRG